MSALFHSLLTCLVLTVAFVSSAMADEKATEAAPAPALESGRVNGPTGDERRPTPLAELGKPLQKLISTGVSLNPEGTVFLDRKQKRVLLRTQVACQDCLLEMLCCTEQTKEHESLLWLRGRAYVVHSGLLALGTKPGKPAVFSPEFQPPTGPTINIFVNWVDADGKLQRADARTWMQTSVSHYFSEPLSQAPPGVKLPLMELRYDPFNKEILWFGAMSEQQRDKLLTLWDDQTYQSAIKKFYEQSQSKPMTAEFVFAGSYSASRVEGGENFYAAEDGYLICVANFAGSMIDVKEASSASDGGQSYEGRLDRVPARGTPVIVELIPAAVETTEKR
ncbi:MAG: YdjY domain-containing protein [Planctomycetaceae bacterium]